MIKLATASEDGALWLAVGATLASLDAHRRRSWMIAGATGPLGIIANYPVKRLFRRGRPKMEAKRLGSAPNELSFPSAHATSSFAAATVMFHIAPRGKLVLLSLAALVGIGRPYLGMHHPSDVLGGAALGILLGRTVSHLLQMEFVAKRVG